MFHGNELCVSIMNAVCPPPAVFQILPGEETSGGGGRPWHAQTSVGEGVQQLSKQNGEEVVTLLSNPGSLVMCRLHF